jgi:PilZ domain
MSIVQSRPGFGAPVQPERRQFGRRAMFRPATAMVVGGATWPCIVVDKSEMGARLKIKDVEDFPDTFKLIIQDDDFVVSCAVVHRTGDFVGVQFVRPPVKLLAPKS